MKRLLLILFIFSSASLIAQKAPKIILHLQSSDTSVYRSMVNQIGHIKHELPDAEIEVLCHGPGIEFLLKKTNKYANKSYNMKLSDVSYVACEATMNFRNLKRDELVEFAETVPYGIVEIVKKQQLGWLYIKPGF